MHKNYMNKTQKHYEGRKKSGIKRVHMIPFTWNSRNGKAIYHSRKNISGLLVWYKGADAD